MSQDSLPSGQNVRTWRCPDFHLWKDVDRVGVVLQLETCTSDWPAALLRCHASPLPKCLKRQHLPARRTRRACTAQNLKISEKKEKKKASPQKTFHCVPIKMTPQIAISFDIHTYISKKTNGKTKSKLWKISQEPQRNSPSLKNQYIWLRTWRITSGLKINLEGAENKKKQSLTAHLPFSGFEGKFLR